MSLDDSELDGQIDLEDFIQMSQSRLRSNSIRDWCISYCESIIPPRVEVDSENLFNRYSMETNFSKKCKSMIKIHRDFFAFH